MATFKRPKKEGGIKRELPSPLICTSPNSRPSVIFTNSNNTASGLQIIRSKCHQTGFATMDQCVVSIGFSQYSYVRRTRGTEERMQNVTELRPLQLQDYLMVLNISYCNSVSNVGDTGKKHASAIQIWGGFRRDRSFRNWVSQSEGM